MASVTPLASSSVVAPAPFVIRLIVSDGKGGATSAFSAKLTIETSDGQKFSPRHPIGHESYYGYAADKSLPFPLTIAPGESFPEITTGGSGGAADHVSITRDGATSLVVKTFTMASGVGASTKPRDTQEFRIKVPGGAAIRLESPAAAAAAPASPAPKK